MYHSQIASISKDGPARQFDIEIASSQIQLMIRDEINDLYGRQKREIWMISEQIEAISSNISKLEKLIFSFLCAQSLFIAGLAIIIHYDAL